MLEKIEVFVDVITGKLAIHCRVIEITSVYLKIPPFGFQQIKLQHLLLGVLLPVLLEHPSKIVTVSGRQITRTRRVGASGSFCLVLRVLMYTNFLPWQFVYKEISWD